RMLAERQGALLEYWRKALDGAPTVLDLPLDRPRPEVQTFEGGVVDLDLRPELMARLEAVCRRQGVTLYTLLLGAYGILLQRHSGQADILIGTPTATRPQASMASAISYLINLVVMRLRFDGAEDLPSFLGALRRQVARSLSHADLPFPVLVENLRQEGASQAHPLVQAMFIYQKAPLGGAPDLTGLALGAPGARIEAGDLALESVPIENRTAQFDLTLIFGEGQRRSRLAFNYSTSLFERRTVELLARRFEVLLEGIAAEPDRAVSALPVLAPGEAETLMRTWNETSTPAEEELCIHQLFEAQVAASPDREALVFEDRSLTFAELDAAANRIAHLLAGRRSGPGHRVGVCLPRGPEMLATLLGVLKTGAAYVPL
ncbi:MAG: condensation domain-containing protein, partial [Acidobacteriota bacterium]